MPKYEYACKSCGERLEVVQSFSDEPLTECPACGGVLRKVFSAPSIAFKGSGFYRTDNRKRRSEPKDAKSEPAKAESTKSDTSDTSGSKEPAKAGTKSEPAKAEPAASSKPKAAEAKSA